MDLLKSSVQGIKWISVSRIGRQVIQFVTIIIIANLVSPKDFGLMASAMIFINFINSFRDFGIGQAIIQNQNYTINFYSSLFWFSLLLGLFFTLLIILGSGFIADILVQTKSESIVLSKILKVLSIGFFLTSIVSIQLATLEKMFHFSIIAPSELISSFSAGVISVVLAFNGYGVWSLVFLSIVDGFVMFILLAIFSPEKPRFVMHVSHIKEVFNFSVNLLGFNFVNYLARNFDYFLISKFLGSTALGYYSLAYRIMFYPIENITNVLSRVLYPVYARIQEDNAKFKNIYKKVALIISAITFPLVVGLMLLSNEFVDIFFGEEWKPMIPLILILSPIALLQSLSTTTGSIYKAKARTDLMFRWGLINSTVVIIAFIIGINFGVIGVAASYLIANLLLIYFWLNIAFKLIDLQVAEFVLALKSVIIPIGIMILMLLVSRLFFDQILSTYINFALSILVGASVYLFTIYHFNKGEISYYKELLFKKETD